MAQILRLGFDDEVDYSSASLGEDPRGRGRSSTSTSVAGSRDSSASRSNSQASTSKLPDQPNKVATPRPASIDPLMAETRRRTFWSCFLLDRTISDGNERPCGLKVPKIASLRMPGSDADFANGRKGIGARFDPDPPPWSVSVRTAQQKKEEEEEASRKSAEDEVVGRIVRSRTTTVNLVEPEADLYGYTLRIADIWRSVASYIGAGGRNVDRRPPWQEDSTFYALAQQLNEFGDRLPQELRYTDQTLIAHCMTSTMDARLFGMLHLLFAAASHVLHRDYLPFLPPADFKVRCRCCTPETLLGVRREFSTDPAAFHLFPCDRLRVVRSTASLFTGMRRPLPVGGSAHSMSRFIRQRSFRTCAPTSRRTGSFSRTRSRDTQPSPPVPCIVICECRLRHLVQSSILTRTMCPIAASTGRKKLTVPKQRQNTSSKIARSLIRSATSVRVNTSRAILTARKG